MSRNGSLHAIAGSALLVLLVFGSTPASAQAETQTGISAAAPSCGQIIPNCASCTGGGTIRCAVCQSGYGVTLDGECQACSTVTANCTSCDKGKCTGCPGNMKLQDGKCVDCTTIDPQCTSCNGNSCTGCASGYGVASGGASCQACSSIDPNCTACGNGACSACKSGYGPAPGGKSCQACTTLNANCTSCSGGKCNSCGNGTAANLQGQCVQPGTPSCKFSVVGQCCECQYECQGWNPPSRSCVGAPANGCGVCQSRQ